MYYLTILDFATGTVDQYDLLNYYEEKELEEWQTEDFIYFLTSEGYKFSNIEWMSHSDNRINKY